MYLFIKMIVNESKISWTVKVINAANWVGLGICFKNIVEKNKFDFVNYSAAQHGGFVISSNGYNWAHNNPSQNSNQTYGISFTTSNIILFELDLKQSILKYINKTTNNSGQLNIVRKNNNEEG